MPQRCRLLAALSCFALSFGLSTSSRADDPRVLLIGFDGCRPDALAKANTPHVDALVTAGMLLDNTRCLPARQTGADSISGPGWSSMLTGVWADKHGVVDNNFTIKNYADYPHFFARLKAVRPDAETYSVAHWSPISENIVSAADQNETAESDEEAEEKLIAALTEQDPVAAFVHFNDPDSTGHSKGFSPAVPDYITAIETLDARVGRIMAALKQRKNFANEDWLVLISTDHGGEGTGHSGGFTNPAIGTMFIVASGQAFEGAALDRQPYIVDVAATAIAHLDIDLDPAWKLDGKPLQADVKQPQDKPAFVPTAHYAQRQVSGWRVMVNKDLLADDNELGPAALKLLKVKLDEIKQLVPAAACEHLQQVTIWLGVNDGSAPCAEYHPSRDWLQNNGYNPEKAKCVEIGCADNFVQWIEQQPAMVLHELAHAYHDQVLGFNHKEVAAAWKAAKDSGDYQQVAHVSGRDREHYALTNPQEFFAEASEAYFSRNDFFPFERRQFKQHDPAAFELVKKLWGDH